MVASTPRPVAVEWLRRWPLWTAPFGLVSYLLAVVSVAAGLGVAGLVTDPPHLVQWASAVMLVGCGVVCVEASRRVGEPAGIAKDLLSAWTLPIALLLPPVLALLAPVPLIALKQIRVRSGLVYRRVFTTAAIGLANGSASVVFHRLTANADPHGGTFLLTSSSVLAAALCCGALCSAVNVVLIATAARLTSPEVRWWDLLGDREQRLLDAGEICLGVVVTGCWTVTPLLALVMLWPIVLVQRGMTHAQLRAAARTDPKTGLLNAGAWEQEADREIVRATRERRPLAILLADLDHFKQVNDIHGHLVGDQVLLSASQALGAGLRQYDLLGRFGGEEFAMLLPNADHNEACQIAERVRRQLVVAPVVAGNAVVEVTVSIGVATLGKHGTDLTDLLTAADLALYRAKANGRNQVALAPTAGGA